MQNWIGKSIGAHVQFKIKDTDLEFTVFTTRPDTLFGATYCVMAPEHEYVEKIATEDKKEEIGAYKKKCATKSELERTELNKDKTKLDEKEIEFIKHVVKTHMGKWNTNPYSDVVLEVPKDRYQYFVHMCDYLASRKFINVKFEGEEIE